MSLSLGLTLSRGTQSITGNYTPVTWKLTYTKGSGTYNNNGVSYYVNVAGTRVKASTIKFSKGTTSGTIASGTTNIAHNADGTHASITGYAYVGPTGFSPSSASVTSSALSLPTIPRASDISVNKSSVPADGSTTITATATKKSTSFTDAIVVTLGSYSQTVTSGTAFTIPLTWCNAISGTSATATVTVTTKSGSTTIGTKSTTFTVTVPESVVPTISSITRSEAVASVKTNFAAYVQTLSQINMKVNAAGIYGSTISSYSVEFDGVKYIQQSFTTNTVKVYGKVPVKATVTDSRGRASEVFTEDVTVINYFAPTITSMTYIPCDKDGTQNSAGTYTMVTIAGKVAPVTVSSTAKNTKTLTLKYKASSASTYTSKTIILSDWTFEASTIISGTDPTVTHEFIAELKDKVSTTTSTVTTGVPVISCYAGGGGVAFFEEASKPGFWVKSFVKVKNYIQTLMEKNPAIYMRTVDGSATRSGRILKNATTDSSGNEVDYGIYITDYTDSNNYTHFNIRDASSSNNYVLRLAICTDGTTAYYPVLSTLICKDYVIETGTSGLWSYEKYYSGKMKIRYSGYLTFTSGYVIVKLPTGWTLIVDTAAAKSPIIMAQQRYIGDKRTADCVLNPASLSDDTPHQFVIYGRTTGATIAGSYYVDILIDGYYK